MPDPEITLPGIAATRAIRMETRKRNPIDNAQSFEVTGAEEHEDHQHRLRHPNAKFRTGLSPIYNCHGLTFGHRRSRIFDAQTIWLIISDDDYEQVGLDDVLPGDVILYLAADTGDVEHSGLVVKVERIGGVNVPWVCSKWGSGSESVHQWGDSPYDPSNVRYYRIRR
jgi:hypothetical protein